VPKKSKKTKQKKTSKRSTAKRKQGRSSPEIVVEEETTRVVPVRRMEVRAEPVTLARALGETAVVEETTEPQVSRTITRRRRRA
jgi:hypothetical protein